MAALRERIAPRVTAVARVCFHSEVAVATDDSTRLLTSRIALVSTAEPSLTSVRNVLPASVRAQSRVTAAAPRLASHIWREALIAASATVAGKAKRRLLLHVLLLE